MAKEAAKAPETKTFILKPGFEHNGFKDGERHVFVGGEKGNDRVELNERQYQAFRDKFTSEAELKAQAFAASGGVVSREDALAALGITEEEYNKIAPAVETDKKPNPTPSVGTAEPAPKDVTPAPVGSASDPVNAAQKK